MSETYTVDGFVIPADAHVLIMKGDNLDPHAVEEFAKTIQEWDKWAARRFGRPLIVANCELESLTAEQLREAGYVRTPMTAYPHGRDYLERYGVDRDSDAARLWESILRLPSDDEAMYSGDWNVFEPRTIALRIGVQAIPLLAEAMKSGEIKDLVGLWPGFPEDAKVVCRFVRGRIDVRIPDYYILVDSETYDVVEEGMFPPVFDLCMKTVGGLSTPAGLKECG